MMRYSAPWSTFLKVVSVGITLLLLGAFWFAGPISTVEESTPFQLFLFAFPVLLLGSSAIFIIRGYEISDDAVEIIRVIGRVSYPIDNIEQVEHDPEAMSFAMRMMANGGMYSYSGFFRNQKLGSFRAYVSNKENTVVLHRKKGSPIVISPGEPKEFVKQLKKLL